MSDSELPGVRASPGPDEIADEWLLSRGFVLRYMVDHRLGLSRWVWCLP